MCSRAHSRGITATTDKRPTKRMVELLLSEADDSQSRDDRARSIALIDKVYIILDAEQVAKTRARS